MIFFDLDGTLVDSNGAWVEVDKEFLSRRGIPHTDEYQEVVVHSIFPVAAQYTKDLYGLSESIEDIMDEWMELAREHYGQKVGLKTGAKEFLEKLAREGERVALVTSSMPELCDLVLNRHGVADFFESRTFSTEVGKLKREPDVWLFAADRAGVAPESITVFEDSPSSLLGVRAAGMKGIAVYDDYFHDRVDELKALTDGRFIMDFTEML